MRAWPVLIASALLVASLAAAWAAYEYGARNAVTIEKAPIPDGDPQTALATAVDAWIADVESTRAASKAQRLARRTAVAWTRSLPRGAPKPPDGKIAVAALSPAADTRIAAFRTAVDGWPNRVVAVDPGTVRPDDDGNVDVAMRIDAALPQAAAPGRTIRHEVTVTMSEQDGTWRVADVAAAPRGLLAYRDPRFVITGPLVLVGEGRHRDLLERLAALAPERLERLPEQYEPIAGKPTGSIFLVEERDQAPPLLERDGDELERRATAWTFDTGDIILAWPDFSDLDPVGQDGTFAHELLHLVTLPAAGRVPPMLLEGIAMEEELLVPGAEDSEFDMNTLVDAFESGEVGYLGLVNQTTEPLAGNYRAAYLAGYATVSYLRERSGDETFVRFLASMRSGLAPGDALRRSYDLTPNRLRHDVEAWAREQTA